MSPKNQHCKKATSTTASIGGKIESIADIKNEEAKNNAGENKRDLNPINQEKAPTNATIKVTTPAKEEIPKKKT